MRSTVYESMRNRQRWCCYSAVEEKEYARLRSTALKWRHNRKCAASDVPAMKKEPRQQRDMRMKTHT